MQLLRLSLFSLLAGLISGDSLHGRALFKSLSTSRDKPVGEGAYQSHDAVKERTTDKNMHCEDGKWGPCYNHDYIDKRGSPPSDKAPEPKKSGAAAIHRILGGLTLTAVVTTMGFYW
mmetsp:Transcript_40585/g.63517  ORF Transcript_40585/g.63517 Transcript_40585/m.63517 type:complete len:117 (+) Transcript_40585:80-430(+)|eukprot:CAMPEP_0169128594 /NCGR_PEP_ID=MMETSP1015-20121227/36656_1 /TAXON_ID=342587 /ORGANISM="Karlodinium micrum, Strain CCMP2283" /LENGTH=116 /DNA_ID=CAMNT_0009192517 /DNA_START=72 /DNA_END=419 /DNA_ORIENTATION=-